MITSPVPEIHFDENGLTRCRFLGHEMRLSTGLGIALCLERGFQRPVAGSRAAIGSKGLDQFRSAAARKSLLPDFYHQVVDGDPTCRNCSQNILDLQDFRGCSFGGYPAIARCACRRPKLGREDTHLFEMVVYLAILSWPATDYSYTDLTTKKLQDRNRKHHQNRFELGPRI